MKFLFSCLVIFILVTATSALLKNQKCQGYDYVYHFGDGLTDIGNAVLVPPINTAPAAFYPYGFGYPPHTPNGRWSDGINDFDNAASDFGIPDIKPYLKKNFTNGIIFSVARSPVLSRGFFAENGIEIAACAISLDEQIDWFKKYLESVCPRPDWRPTCTKKRLNNSLLLLGDIEGNDIGYALSQGKSIDEVKSYIPTIVNKQIAVATELLNMGATKLIIPGNSLIGCYPYILTARATRDSSAYDEYGCLKDVNELVLYKNNELNETVIALKEKHPNKYISYAPYNEGFLRFLEKVNKTEDRKNMLKACCGTGGMYNYDESKFCSSAAATVCPDPTKYVFWDGLHMTDKAQSKIEEDLVQGFLHDFNCTRSPSPPRAATAEDEIGIAYI